MLQLINEILKFIYFILVCEEERLYVEEFLHELGEVGELELVCFDCVFFDREVVFLLVDSQLFGELFV